MAPTAAFSRLPARWRLIDQPLSAQFLVAGGMVAFFSVLSLLLLLRQVDRQAAASQYLASTHRAVGRLNTLERDFYQQQTALREYLRTTEALYLATSMEGRQLCDDDFAALKEIFLGDELYAKALSEAEDGYRAWVSVADGLTSTARERRSSGHLDPALVRDEAVLFKQAFLMLERLIDRQNRLLVLRDAAEKSGLQSTFILISAFNIALLVIIGFVLGKLYGSIARPIALLSESIRRYEGGDFKTRVDVSNRSQIGFLEASFNVMAGKIEAMVGDLRKLDELKTEFLSTVSHELRTPLTSIGGYAKLLIGGDAGPVTDTQREFLHIVDTNVVRLTHLINDILDVEKMESGKIQMLHEPQRLQRVLKEVRDTFDVLARQKGLELRYQVPDEDLSILGDRDRLVQIFMNLVSNAIKYTKTGFVEIDVDHHDYAVAVRVRDSGVGLTADERDKLFQKFYRARSGLSSTEGGTGLGLVIVRGLVEAHGGTISVDSEPGRGTTFTVAFPLSTEVVPAERVAAQQAAKALAKSIWIIDPDEVDARAMAAVIEEQGLHHQGYRLVPIRFDSIVQLPQHASGPEAPALVVFSPQSSEGQEFEALRRRVGLGVPVIVVSSSVDAASAFSRGASAYLGKPVEQDPFRVALVDQLSRKGWKVLVADSNTDLRLLIKRGLEQRGAEVVDVDRGSTVLGRLEQEKYDLLLLDLHLPDISGADLVKIVRRVPRFRELPLFLMSVDDPDEVVQAQVGPLGATHFVAKYRGLGAIVNTVCQFLEDRKLAERIH